jgi:hypothetical protein
MNFLLVPLVPLLMMFVALSMERLETHMCGTTRRQDELDDLAEQTARLASKTARAELSPAHARPSNSRARG